MFHFITPLFEPEAFHTENYKKLYYNVCAPFIPYPTPLASLWLGRILVEILDSVDMTLTIFAFEGMGVWG